MIWTKEYLDNYQEWSEWEREGIIQEGAGDTPGTWDKGGDTVNMGALKIKYVFLLNFELKKLHHPP